jgi:hypothetical protein
LTTGFQKKPDSKWKTTSTPFPAAASVHIQIYDIIYDDSDSEKRQNSVGSVEKIILPILAETCHLW